jgi:polysaccharide biosynthesis/export protein
MIQKTISLSVVSFLLIISFAACKTQKANLNYFSADRRDSSYNRIWQDYEAKIQPGDKLAINVTALNPESARPYSLSAGSSSGTGMGGQTPGITVDPNGSILYPQLGFIKAAGLTKGELRDTLLNRLKIYLTDPVVTVDFVNFKITVLGEVGKQGPISVPDGSITLLEALGAAGDITMTGMRDSVIVIRESGDKREFGYVNLLSNTAFKSPYFALRQNDVVYVPMNERKVKTENEQVFVRNLSIITSVLAVLSTVGLLILNLTK